MTEILAETETETETEGDREKDTERGTERWAERERQRQGQGQRCASLARTVPSHPCASLARNVLKPISFLAGALEPLAIFRHRPPTQLVVDSEGTRYDSSKLIVDSGGERRVRLLKVNRR